MIIPPKYTLTHRVAEYLKRIEAAREIINTIQIPPAIETNIRRQTTLKSSLYSARIEGNPLTLEEMTQRPSNDQRKQEVMNILNAFQFIRAQGRKNLTLNLVLQIHKKVMDNLAHKNTLGKFRNEVSAIFNTAGIAIYLPPPPSQISYLMDRLIRFTNSPKESFIPIRAALAHYSFEKIHPFLDGNGRVGRLILQAVLEKGGYGMKGLLPVEEYLDTNRIEYYRSLEESEHDVTGYVEFMLEAVAETADKAKQLVLEKQDTKIEDYLLPRRSEILNIIRDHRLVSFNFINRRFMAVNARTLRYDLKKLVDSGLIRKRGRTKGAHYELIEK